MPFSIFPSTYKDSQSQTQTQTHEQVDISLPNNQHAGREGQYSSFTAGAEAQPQRQDSRYEQEVRFSREEDDYRRPGFQHEHHEHHIIDEQR